MAIGTARWWWLGRLVKKNWVHEPRRKRKRGKREPEG